MKKEQVEEEEGLLLGISDDGNGSNSGQIILKLNMTSQTANDLFLKHAIRNFDNHSHSVITESSAQNSKHETLYSDE